MRLVTLTVARNEADVLEAFVRHNSALADRMIVVCHFCQDSSFPLLEELAAEGLPVEVRELEGPTFDQRKVSTALLEEAAARFDPDWILPLDADEFLVVASGEGLAGVFDSLPRDRATQIPWRTYVPREGDDTAEPNVLRRVRHRAAETWGGKVLVPRELREVRRVAVAEGHHRVYEANTGAALPHEQTDALALAHYPVRTAGQLHVKVLGGWPARRSTADFRAGSSFHLQGLFDELVADGPLPPQALESIARSYAAAPDARTGALVVDPVGARFELTHPVQAVDALSVTARTAEALAAALGELRAQVEASPWRRLRRLPGKAARLPRRLARRFL